MTQVQAVTLTTRVICAWLIYQAAFEFFAAVKSGFLLGSGVFSTFDGVDLSRMTATMYGNEATVIVEFCFDVALAVIFYRCGPRLLGFFLGGGEPDSAVNEAHG